MFKFTHLLATNINSLQYNTAMTIAGGASERPHVAVCGGAGICHLIPCLSLASALSTHNCAVTLVITVPVISAAETDVISSFTASHPDIRRLDFRMDSRPQTQGIDPFHARYDALSHNSHLLGRYLPTLIPPLQAVFSEFSLTRGINTSLPSAIPNYTVVPISARFFGIMLSLPRLHDDPSKLSEIRTVEVPGIGSFPRKDLPPPYFSHGHPFADLVVSNARHLHLSKGVILNTFEAFEPRELAALRSGGVVPNLPPLFPFAPLHAARKKTTLSKEIFAAKVDETISWLDEQPDESVVYVAFGSRTVLPREQLREVAKGLKMSGWRFLWVVKAAIVDIDDKHELEELLGKELHDELANSEKAKIARKWVNQDEILGHRAVGGFMSHAGWSSVLEAARHGVRVLAWPLGGDQPVNAGSVEVTGLGVWEGWGTEQVVAADEIAAKVKAVMAAEELKKTVAKIKEEAEEACKVGGTSMESLEMILKSFKPNHLF